MIINLFQLVFSGILLHSFLLVAVLLLHNRGVGNFLVAPKFHPIYSKVCPFIYLGLFVAFNTVEVISRRVVGRTEETSTYSLSGFCTVNC